MAEITRKEMVRGLRQFLDEAPLDDARYGKLITAVAKIRNQLAGPVQPLPQGERSALLERLAAQSPQHPRIRARLALYLLDCCAVGEDGALLLVGEELIADRLTKEDAKGLRRLIAQLGFALRPGNGVLERLRDLLLQSALDFPLVTVVMDMAGLSPEFPVETRAAAFHSVFLPTFAKVAETQSIDAVLLLEHFVYNAYIKAQEEPDHHKRTFAALEPIIGRAARQQKVARRPLNATAGVPKVAFLLPNGHYLAHTEVLLAFLQGLMALEQRPIIPLVYLLADRGAKEIVGPLQRLDVPLRINSLSPAEWTHVAAFSECRAQLARENVDAVVFVSLPGFIAYCTEVPLAPVQIWWSMKFPLPNFPKLDGRVFYRSLFNQSFELDGAIWRGGPLGLAPPPDADPAEVAAVRSKLPGRRILGTIARAEKIREPSFLDMVVRLLRKYPDACFLWTGRHKLPEIEAHFAAGGVAERCHFVGWVNPGVYCRVLDLFLETYPLTGLMAAWSMALARPVVSVGRLGFLGTYLEGVFDGSIPCPPGERERLDAVFAPLKGRLPYLWADTPAEMDGIADAVLADPALAEALGRAQQAFIRNFLSDPASSAAIQAGHFRAIIDEKRRASRQ